jgi:hypothetical protein
MAKAKETKEARKVKGNFTKMNGFKGLSKPLILWNQFMHKITDTHKHVR